MEFRESVATAIDFQGDSSSQSGVLIAAGGYIKISWILRSRSQTGGRRSMEAAVVNAYRNRDCDWVTWLVIRR